MKKLLLVSIFTLCFIIPSQAAEVAYKSYTYDATGRSIPSPAPYIATRVLSGADSNTAYYNNPLDLYVANGQIYISDTGNDRIVVLDSNFQCIREIRKVVFNGEEQNLRQPKGVFVDKGGYLYIADTGNNRVIKCDRENRVLAAYGRPDSDLIPDDIEYKPEKVVVDTAGTVYVSAYGIYQGLITYDENGQFSGFFGSSRVEMTLENLALYAWKSVFSKEQRQAMLRFIPVEYSNIFIDEKGFIYTSTRSTETSLDEIKKMNALGQNILRIPETGVLYPKNNFGDIERDMQQGKMIDSKFGDVHVDSDGIISALDIERCRVFQYDQELNLLFVFGDKGYQQGMAVQLAAIDKLGDNYLLLDSAQNTITVMEPTYYCIQFRNAIRLYNEGHYEQAQKVWRELLSLNSNCLMAYRGIGKTLMQQEKYKEAMACFKKAQDRVSYSEALSVYRKEVVRRYLLFLVLGIAFLLLGIVQLSRSVKNRLGFASKRARMIFR